MLLKYNKLKVKTLLKTYFLFSKFKHKPDFAIFSDTGCEPDYEPTFDENTGLLSGRGYSSMVHNVKCLCSWGL